MGLVPYVFEGSQIRVQLGDDGQPLFAAKDVCSALGVDNSSQALSRLDDDEKGVISNETLGGTQSMAAVTEPGLYALILGSRKPEAKKFGRWVRHEVLPAIRATGSYTAPAAEPVTPLRLRSPAIEAHELANEMLLKLGVAPGIAAAAIMRDVEANMGVSLANAAKALPAITADLGGMTASKLGERLGFGTGQAAGVKANRLLAERSLQFKHDKAWLLTDEGKKHADAFPYNRNGHSGTQILWRDSVVNVLGQVVAT